MNPTEAIESLESKGWGIQEIAAQTGIHFTTIYRLRKGRVKPTYETACRLIELAKRGRKPPRRKV